MKKSALTVILILIGLVLCYFFVDFIILEQKRSQEQIEQIRNDARSRSEQIKSHQESLDSQSTIYLKIGIDSIKRE